MGDLGVLSTLPPADKVWSPRGLVSCSEVLGEESHCPFLDHTQCWEQTGVGCVPSAWFCKGILLWASLLLAFFLLVSLFLASPSYLRKKTLTSFRGNKGQLIDHLASQGRNNILLRGLYFQLIITL